MSQEWRSYHRVTSSSDRVETGKAAVLFSSDLHTSTFFKDVQSQFDPNGYIVGVGFGGLLTLPNCFHNPNLVKGVGIVDINPFTILHAILLEGYLRRYKTYKEFHKAYYDTNQYLEDLSKITRDNKELDRDSLSTSSRARIAEIPSEASTLNRHHNTNPNFHFYFDPVTALENFYPLFKKLADQRKISIIYGNIFRGDVARYIINSFPGFPSLRNILYISNAASMNGMSGKNVPAEGLSVLSSQPEKPIFISSDSDNELLVNATTSLAVLNARNRQKLIL